MKTYNLILCLVITTLVPAMAEIDHAERKGVWKKTSAVTIPSEDGPLNAEVREIDLTKTPGTVVSTVKAQAVFVPSKHLFWEGPAQAPETDYSFFVLKGRIVAVRCSHFGGIGFYEMHDRVHGTDDEAAIDNLLDLKLQRYSSDHLEEAPEPTNGINLEDYLVPSPFMRGMKSSVSIVPSLYVRHIAVTGDGFTLDLGHHSPPSDEALLYDAKATAQVTFANDFSVVRVVVNGKQVFPK